MKLFTEIERSKKALRRKEKKRSIFVFFTALRFRNFCHSQCAYASAQKFNFTRRDLMKIEKDGPTKMSANQKEWTKYICSTHVLKDTVPVDTKHVFICYPSIHIRSNHCPWGCFNSIEQNEIVYLINIEILNCFFFLLLLLLREQSFTNCSNQLMHVNYFLLYNSWNLFFFWWNWALFLKPFGIKMIFWLVVQN